jgi:small-conductance mechanosensitive channel
MAHHARWPLCSLVLGLLLAAMPLHAAAIGLDEALGGQAQEEAAAPAPPIATSPDADQEPEATDRRIARRLDTIFAQVEGLEAIEVRVSAGVVTLSGEVANEQVASDAIALADRLEGAVLVRDKIVRSRDIEGNVSPLIEGLSDDLDAAVAALPLVGIALLVFLAIAFLGHLLASWTRLWERVLPNSFLAELVAQAIRIIALVIGVVIALTLVGATALLGTVLGGAGIVGIAIGFAVRDTLENYVSSIMLSLRQPFRAGDHVLINEHEGNVIRLTSRATVLMTLDGNHLRIPNATVFKGVILNYTRNPERRFDFMLGIDADDDPAAGMATGVEALGELPFLLREPAPMASIEQVGDSSIVLCFFAWIDQRETDFLKARSLAIRAAKLGLEEAGFTLPEPIYRLRFDPRTALPLSTGSEEQGKRQADGAQSAGQKQERARQERAAPVAEGLDTQPATHAAETAAREREASTQADLLDDSRPIE